MSNIYLISSSSVYLIEEEIKKIVKDNPYATFDLNNSEIVDIVEEASYISLFDDLKYMVVKNADIFLPSKKKKKNDIDFDVYDNVSKKDEVLLKYLESPNSNTVLIFTVFGKVDVRKRISKIIKDRYIFIDIPEMKTEELVSYVIKNLSKDGFKIDKDAAKYIVDNCLNNYDLVVNELNKIRLYYIKPLKLNINNIDGIISKNIEDNNFKFIDVVFDKNIKLAFKMYDDLIIQKVEPIMLLSMFTKEIRNLLIVKKVMKTVDRKTLLSILGFKSEWQLEKLYNRVNKFTISELEKLLIYLCDIDLKIKTGKISNKLALQLFIMEMCK